MSDGKVVIEYKGDTSGIDKANAETKSKLAEFTKGAALAVGAAAVAAGAAIVKMGSDFESAFAGVKKTVDATDAQLAALRKGILEMSKNLPGSAVEIAAVAEAAGQLGIKVPNILAFTRAMIDLGESTNLTADEAATQLARFANITGMSQKDFGKLGSVIVDLGNNFATTEAEIVAMGMRLAGAGTQVGMTEGEIMGLAAALSSVGIEAEMGGSAISKVMINMAAAGSTADKLDGVLKDTGYSLRELQMMASHDGKSFGALAANLGMTKTELTNLMKSGADLKGFAEIAGMTGEQFKKAFEKDAAGALNAFIQGLGGADNASSDTIAMLDELGIREVRLRDSLLRAAGAGDLLTDALKMGNRAWDENTALTKEAEQRYETLESQFEMLKNRVAAVAIEMYDDMRPALINVIDGVNELFNTLESDGTLEALGKTLGSLAETIGEAIVAILPLVIDLINQLLPPLLEIIDAVLPPLLAIITEIVETVLPVFADLLAELMPILKPLIELFMEIIQAILPIFAELISLAAETMKPFIELLVQIIEAVVPIFIDLLNQLIPLFQPVIEAFQELAERLLPLYMDIIQKVIDAMMPMVEALLPVLIDLFDAIIPLLVFLIELYADLMEAILPIIGEILPVLIDLFTAIIPIIGEIIKTLLPPLIELFKMVIEPIKEIISVLLPPLINLFKMLIEPIKTLIEAILPVFTALMSALKPIFDALGPVIKVLAELFSGALGAALEIIMKPLQILFDILGNLIDFIINVFTGNWKGAWENIVGIFKGIINVVPAILEGVINGAIWLINSIIKGINKVTGAIGIKPIGEIPKVNIPRLQVGLDFVPEDDYLAMLHKGEAVLRAEDAAKWRASQAAVATANYHESTANSNVVNNYTYNSPRALSLRAMKQQETMTAQRKRLEAYG